MMIHLTMTSRGRLTIARDEAERRAVVPALARLAGDRLLLFCLADDHVHAVLRRVRQARLAARDVRLALGRLRADLAFESPHVRPVEDLERLMRLVRYELIQPVKHRLPGHPALWTGSCFQGLAGARALPGFDPTAILQEFPRFLLGDVFDHVGLERRILVPASDDDLRQAGAAKVLALAHAVHAVSPQPGLSKSHAVTVARALAMRVGVQLGWRQADLARGLEITRQSAHNLLQLPRERSAELALRRRWTLELRARVESVRGGVIALRAVARLLVDAGSASRRSTPSPDAAYAPPAGGRRRRGSPRSG